MGLFTRLLETATSREQSDLIAATGNKRFAPMPCENCGGSCRYCDDCGSTKCRCMC